MSLPNPDQHADPGGEAAARVAQLAAMAVSVAEAVARLRAQRLHNAADLTDRAAAAERARVAAHDAASRIVYGAALDDDWRQHASTSQLLDAWGAAQPYVISDVDASLAVGRVEERLRRLHPEAMSAYDSARRGGFPAADCLDVAGLLWRGEYGLDPMGTPVARSLADLEHGRAADGRATSDRPGTTLVDERLDGLVDTARHDGSAARFEASSRTGPGVLDRSVGMPVVVGHVAEQAFPVDIRTAMAAAHDAAKARLAIAAPPQRRQLTAGPAARPATQHPVPSAPAQHPTSATPRRLR
jgi:hypothetical protein